MRYWWVNQNQTYRHEVPGGYLWSPKRRSDGRRNPFYDFMREVAPGDIVFSFADTRIKAIGVIASHAYEAPKPLEFGQTGAYWDLIGWRVDVRFVELRHKVRPSEFMQTLAPLLPVTYSPLGPTGRGRENLYLTRLAEELAASLVDLIGVEARELVLGWQASETLPVQPAVGLIEWEEHQLADIRANIHLPETEKKAVVMARRGQGLFKQRVMDREHSCRITGVNQMEHLRASHCKPWRDATNDERLDGENGLLLTPSADHLFDRGFIGFEDNGDVLFSQVAHAESLRRMGLDSRVHRNVGRFSEGQQRYLVFHRDRVLLRSNFLEAM